MQRYFPSWILGLVAGAGALAALVPASALLLAASSVIAKNVLGDAFGVATSDRSRTLLTRIVVVVVAVLALGIWMVAQKTVVELLLLYYNGITQFFPGVVAAFVWKRATAWGVGLGILAGVGVAVPLAALNILPFGMNPRLRCFTRKRRRSRAGQSRYETCGNIGSSPRNSAKRRSCWRAERPVGAASISRRRSKKLPGPAKSFSASTSSNGSPDGTLKDCGTSGFQMEQILPRVPWEDASRCRLP